MLLQQGYFLHTAAKHCVLASSAPGLCSHCAHILYDVEGYLQISRRYLQLMQVARKCPTLQKVVLRKDRQTRVDYSSVKKAFPKLVITADKERADSDVLAMSVFRPELRIKLQYRYIRAYTK